MNREFLSWYFLRVSGLALIVLALGHFTMMHVVNSILDVNYQFAAGRWAAPFWRAYDWLLLVLALLHGFNGLRVVVNEHVRPPRWRAAAQRLVAALAIGFLVLGTVTVITFQPVVR